MEASSVHHAVRHLWHSISVDAHVAEVLILLLNTKYQAVHLSCNSQL